MEIENWKKDKFNKAVFLLFNFLSCSSLPKYYFFATKESKNEDEISFYKESELLGSQTKYIIYNLENAVQDVKPEISCFTKRK